ncbi:hypothetical protein RFI_28499 [Reticulomyxa filosa]|uniref:Uncharacterized protein n=1 Tax=Reticulomyxa filosa TaxID=46433 RepID=X6M4J3_RETFI|nr:hypothetical protein RFI_28499 [Reticulomyxa filosa]|eukprot:ETO08888.1 hypothetical protein RFI_28499 [Reticulomyxa filosa]
MATIRIFKIDWQSDTCCDFKEKVKQVNGHLENSCYLQVVKYHLISTMRLHFTLMIKPFNTLKQNIKKLSDISPLQSNDNKNNSIDGNGCTICSGSWIISFEYGILKQKKLTVFKKHENELINIILSGSDGCSVRLWCIRSGQQIQVFNGHTNNVMCVEYIPFVIKSNSEVVSDNSNVICFGSIDNSICFGSNKNELYLIKGDERKDFGITCLKFIGLKRIEKNKDNIYLFFKKILNVQYYILLTMICYLLIK